LSQAHLSRRKPHRFFPAELAAAGGQPAVKRDRVGLVEDDINGITANALALITSPRSCP
jgi:hypothetical protein